MFLFRPNDGFRPDGKGLAEQIPDRFPAGGPGVCGQADLHPRAFGVGNAIVTALGPVPVILHHSADHEYRIYPRASFADFTVRWLLDGMAEFLNAEAVAG